MSKMSLTTNKKVMKRKNPITSTQPKKVVVKEEVIQQSSGKQTSILQWLTPVPRFPPIIVTLKPTKKEVTFDCIVTTRTLFKNGNMAKRTDWEPLRDKEESKRAGIMTEFDIKRGIQRGNKHQRYLVRRTKKKFRKKLKHLKDTLERVNDVTYFDMQALNRFFKEVPLLGWRH